MKTPIKRLKITIKLMGKDIIMSEKDLKEIQKYIADLEVFIEKYVNP